MAWKELRHNGVAFPPPYEPRRLSIRIRETVIQLSPAAEELAYAWGKKRTTPYIQDPVFQANFLSDFLKLLPPNFASTKYAEIDFTPVFEFQAKEELQRQDIDYKKKMAAQRKQLRLLLKEKYGFAEIDGVKTEVANWMVEPPSLFMGRGSHPMRGRWKPRIHPEDVVLNLSENVEAPSGNWKEIVHDHESIWIAYWVDKLSNVRKYVWPSDISDLRQERDKLKYDAARKLQRRLPDVRQFIDKSLLSPDLKIRKLATVSYLIDNLAMRVGDEKGEDEADTVGASTLRVEHLKFLPHGVEFDFLGKDSVRWQKTLKVDGANNPIRKNLQEFSQGKRPDDLVFDGITSQHVNRFLNKAVRGLTAKVFRTHHATETVQTYLRKHNGLKPGESLLKKQQRLDELTTKEVKTDKQKMRLEERIRKLKLDMDLQKRTRDYNLNTSLRNYIDPRVYKSWANKAEFDWKGIYPKTLQRKFLWASRAKS